MTLNEYLRHYYGDHDYLEAFIARHVAQHGREFVPIKRPKGVRKRRDRNCFFNAQDCVLSGQVEKTYAGAQYVEGFACSANFPSVPMEHGWITFDGVHAVDVTWREPGVAYCGIVIDSVVLARRIIETGTRSDMLSDIVRPAFDEYWRTSKKEISKWRPLADNQSPERAAS